MASLDVLPSWRLLALVPAVLVCLLALPVVAQDTGSDEARPTEGEATEEEDAAPNPLDELKGAGTEQDPFQELFEDISNNMKRIEELLNQRETGGSCQEVQKQTLERIDELIVLVEKACQQASGGQGVQGGQASKQHQPSRSQKQSRQQQQQSERELQRNRDEQLGQQEQQQKPMDGEPESPDQVPNTRTSEGEMPPALVGDLQPREGFGRWGQLPKRLIEEMYDNGNRKLPEKYRLVLEEYWRQLPKSTAK